MKLMETINPKSLLRDKWNEMWTIQEYFKNLYYLTSVPISSPPAIIIERMG